MIVLSEICQDYAANNRDINLAGRKALFVYRFGQWRMTIRSRLFRAPMSVLYRYMERRVRFRYGIEIPYSAQIGTGLRIEHQHGIVIHGNTRIGSRCTIRHGVTIGMKNTDESSLAPIIGDDVDIGAGAVIIGEITIGHRVRIGANSVVVKSVPDDCVVAGNPARIIRHSAAETQS